MKIVIKVPPRPEVIRERYAGFLAEQAKFIARYKEHFMNGMNERFSLKVRQHLQSPINGPRT